MDNIYIIFSKTNTKMGWIIRKALKYEYNHVSLLIDGNSYSFGRKYYNLPFVGGFIMESPERIAYPKNEVHVRIYKIPVTGQQKAAVNGIIDSIRFSKDPYLYNLLSPWALLFNKELKIYKVHTCVTFITAILSAIDIPLYNTSTPEELTGHLRNFEHKDMTLRCSKSDCANDDSYLKQISGISKIKYTLLNILVLAERINIG